MDAITLGSWRCGRWCVVRLSSIAGALAAAGGQRCATLAGGAAGGALVHWQPLAASGALRLLALRLTVRTDLLAVRPAVRRSILEHRQASYSERR
jgi:hypothetical protein